MAPTNTNKETARRLFFQSNMSRKQIAEATGVNIRTLFDWVNQGDWLRAKDTVLNAPTFLVEQYYNQLTALNKTIAEREHSPYPDKEESEIMRRITTTLKAVKAKHTRPELVDILTDFSAFAIHHTPNMADELQVVIGAYLEQLCGNGPAARLARIKSPQQAANAYQAHIKDILEYDSSENQSLPQEPELKTLQETTEREMLQIAAGIKEIYPLTALSTEKPGTQPHPFYGVPWVDHIAERGTSPMDLVKLIPYHNTPNWLRLYKQPTANPFKLMKEFAQRNIGPQFFIDHIYASIRPPALTEACTLYPDYIYPETQSHPTTTSQNLDAQHQPPPIQQNFSAINPT